jgi:hypothetical protein
MSEFVCDQLPEFRRQPNGTAKVGLLWDTAPMNSIDMAGRAVEAFGSEVSDESRFTYRTLHFGLKDGDAKILVIYDRVRSTPKSPSSRSSSSRVNPSRRWWGVPMGIFTRLCGRKHSGRETSKQGAAKGVESSRQFVETYPQLCVVCTSLPKSDFRDADEMKWLLDNRDVLIGSFLGLEEPTEIRQLVKRWETEGFRTQVMAGVSREDLLSGEAAKLARAGLHVYGLSPAEFRVVPMGMNDVYQKTDVVVFCWFFKNEAQL